MVGSSKRVVVQDSFALVVEVAEQMESFGQLGVWVEAWGAHHLLERSTALHLEPYEEDSKLVQVEGEENEWMAGQA